MVLKFFNSINKVYVINLKKDQYRRKRVEMQLSEMKISYELIDAVSHEDKDVKEMYKNNKVKSFPPCFRCLEDICDHENNYLAPKQVANFLSFKKIMEIIHRDKINHSIIFEDDFNFKFFSKKSFKHLDKYLKDELILDQNEPILLRIGCHTTVNKKYYVKFFLLNRTTFMKNTVNMANPCFYINLKFAELFLNDFDNIETTSDNYIHRKLIRKYKVKNYSMYPFPIMQLSYGKKNNFFKSSINPDQSSILNFENKNKVFTKKEYDLLLSEWLSS